MKSKAYMDKVEQIGYIEAYLQRFCDWVAGLELSDDGEVVTILYNGGGSNKVSIACDSNLAIMIDIAKGVRN